MAAQASKTWLRELAKHVVRTLRSADDPGSITLRPLSRLAASEGNADGWYVDIGRIRGVRAGMLEIWLDRWAGTKKRVLSFCYRGPHATAVRRIAQAGTSAFGRSILRSGKVHAAESAFVKMPRTLKRREFGRPVFEAYSNHDCYYGVYLPRAPRPTKQHAAAAARRIARFMRDLASSVTAIASGNAADDAYPAVENRSLVVRHLRRERSARLARQAKLRDGFTCQTCGLNFEHRFGQRWRGIAEAHHKKPLRVHARSIKITLDDLVTVCPNCHTMLHHMSGARGDVARLRIILKRASADDERTT